MRQLILREHPYKAIGADGKRNCIYRVYENGAVIAAWHEDEAKPYTCAIVKQYTSGDYTGYTCRPYREMPDVVGDVYGIARLETLGNIVSGTDAKFTDGTKVKVDNRGMIEF